MACAISKPQKTKILKKKNFQQFQKAIDKKICLFYSRNNLFAVVSKRVSWIRNSSMHKEMPSDNCIKFEYIILLLLAEWKKLIPLSGR